MERWQGAIMIHLLKLFNNPLTKMAINKVSSHLSHKAEKTKSRLTEKSLISGFGTEKRESKLFRVSANSRTPGPG